MRQATARHARVARMARLLRALRNAQRLCCLCARGAASAGARAADGFQTPANHVAGRMHALLQAAYQPDANAVCRVVFGLTGAAARPDQISPGLKRVVCAVNLYVQAGVRLKPLHFVAITCGAAATALDDAHHQKQYDVPDHNLPMIAQLRKAGVDVAVCGAGSR